jgi:hypothetical protein
MYDAELHELENGSLYPFSAWPNPLVPYSAGVYIIWDAGGKCIYAGMSGCNLTKEAVQKMKRGKEKKGLYQRLNAHASGYRSGDKFCVYVADRLVLPTLDRQVIDEIGQGIISLDSLTKDYIRRELSYRFIEVEDGATALTIESAVKRGELSAGRPFLNPG